MKLLSKEKYNKYFNVLFVIIMIGIIVITFFSAKGEVVPFGNCVYYNYTAYDCSLNSTQFISKEYCCNTPEVVNISNNVYYNVTLSPGESRIGNKENCYFDMKCSSCNCNSNYICSKSMNLDAGEKYELHDNACDIDFECEESDCEDDTYYIEQEIKINIRKEANYLYIDAPGTSKTYNVNLTSLSDEIYVKLQCPTIVSNDSITNVEWTYNNCRQWTDYLESKNLYAYDLYAKYMQEGQKSSLDFASGVLAGEEEYRNQLIVCQSGLVNQETLRVELQRVNSDNTNFVKQIKELESDRTSLLWLSVIVGLLFVLVLAKGVIQDGWFSNDEVTE